MKSSATIRTLDRYIGSLLCFILSLGKRFGISKNADKNIKNILLIELFEMGASIMAYPSIHYIRKNFPDANIYILTTESIKASWLKINEIKKENVFALAEISLVAFLISFYKSVRIINQKKIDVVIDFELFYRITAIFSCFISAKTKAGFFRYSLEGLYRGSIHNVRCHFNQNSHVSRNFLALTKSALKTSNDYPEYKNSISVSELTYGHYESNSLLLPDLEREINRSLNIPFLTISPDVGPNLSCRNYPIEQLIVVIKKLLILYPTYNIFLIGTQENVSVCNRIIDAVHSERLISLAGKTSMDQLFELLLKAKLLISNDNGPVHFATLTDTPTLALYSTDSPFVYGSLGKCLILYSFYQCSPCIMAYNHKNSLCSNNRCLQVIAPERVVDFAVKILQGNANYRTINNETPYLF
jgi:ADP-heptose:LPS heptosyltransferase